jgi:hypothetical protein
MMRTNTNINESKRWFLKLTALFSIMPVNNITIRKANASMFIDDDIVVVNGWVLLRSDLS